MLLKLIGLFVGAITLALGYTILTAWMETDEFGNPRNAEPEPATEGEAR